MVNPGRYRVPWRDLRSSAPPPPSCPHGEGDEHGACKREPGDGVLQVIVLEMHVERSRTRNAVLGRGLLEVDIERRNRAPAQRARDRHVIAYEPQPLVAVLRWSQPAGRL